jgi:hypothetical protein
VNTQAFLGAVAVLPLIASGAIAGKSSVLWDQNTASEGGVLLSDNTSAGADDFVVPSGQTWLIKEVDVTGVYLNGSGPAKSEVVTFYSDKKDLPRRVKAGPFTLNCADNFGSFHCVLPTRVKLPAGTWWVSVVANLNFSDGGEWGWNGNSTVHGNEAAYKQSSGNCTKWTPLHVCFGGPPSDLAFSLLGRAVEN